MTPLRPVPAAVACVMAPAQAALTPIFEPDGRVQEAELRSRYSISRYVMAIPLALAATVATSGVASGQSHILAEGRAFYMVCGTGAPQLKFCGPKADPNAKPHASAGEAAEMVQEMDRIKQWLDSLGYDDAPLPFDDTRRVRVLAQHDASSHNDLLTENLPEGCGGSSTDACVIRSRSGTSFIITHRAFGSGKYSKAVLAHELSHLYTAVSMSRTNWLNEALAEAVGLRWARSRHNLTDHSIDNPRVSMYLDVPFHEAAGGGYEHAYYMLFVGERLKSRDVIAWQSRLTSLPDDSQNGMSYLYGSAVGSQTFRVAFPAFVAGINPSASAWGKYYANVPSIDEAWRKRGDQYVLTMRHGANAYTAAPIYFGKIGHPDAAADPKDNLMVAEIRLDDLESAAPGDVRLAHEHRLMPTGADQHRTRFLIRAEQSNNLGLTRVIHAPDRGGVSAKASYRMVVEATPVRFVLPTCLAPSASADLAEGYEEVLRGIGNYQLRVRGGGTLKGTVYTAPAGEATVNVQLRIQSPITTGPAFQPQRRPDIEVDLGEMTVGKSCLMIRMTMDDAVGTWDGNRGYTQYRYRDGRLLFMGRKGGATFDEEGWKLIPPEQLNIGPRIPAENLEMLRNAPPQMREALRNLPPDARAAMSQALSNPGMGGSDVLGNMTAGLAGLPAMMMGGASTTDTLGHLPKMFTEKFNWSTMTRAARAARPSGAVSAATACPAGISVASPCQSIVAQDRAHGEDVRMTYDAGRQLVAIRINGSDIMRFEYGRFPITRPPGW